MAPIYLKKEPNYAPKKDAFLYQAEVVEAASKIEYAAIFLEQGLGKTKVAIDLMLRWFISKDVDTALIVVKKNLLKNWEKELSFHSFLRPRILTQNRASNYFVFNSPARVILTNYETIRSEQKRLELFLHTRTVGIILDESVKIKNPHSALSDAFFKLSPLFKKRIIMTGTPVANRPYDLWGQIYFLDQGRSLGSDFESFKAKSNLTNEFSKDPLARKRFEDYIEKFYKKIEAFSIRKRKADGLISLPDKKIVNISADWGVRQKELYEQIRIELQAVVVKQGQPLLDNNETVLKRLVRLVQVASNPRLIDESYEEEPGKISYLKDVLARIRDRNEKCIIWTSFIDNVEWIANEIGPENSVCLHGKMKMTDRNASVESFLTNPEKNLMVATPGSAKEGLTLTVANNVIFYDRTFSLDDYLQAQDRIHRISQEKECTVYNLIMKSSIDEWVDVLLRAKSLAAQLSQGDVNLDKYQEIANYDYGIAIKEILNIH